MQITNTTFYCIVLYYGEMKHHCPPSLVHFMFTCTNACTFLMIAADYRHKINKVKKDTQYKMLQKYNGYNVHRFKKGYTILQL